MSETARPIAHFLAFTAMLRRAGFAVAPEQTMAWLAAIELLGPAEVDDIRRAARATLAPPPERFAEFDALFAAHFLGALHPSETSRPSEEAPLQAAEEGPGGLEPMFGEETRESGARATRPSGSRRGSSRRPPRKTRCDALLARFPPACRGGAATAGARHAAARGPTRGACFATRCAMPVSS